MAGFADKPPVISPYTDRLKKIASSYDSEQFKRDYKADGPSIRCFSTPDHPFYIGIEQALRIHAPLARVDATIADISGYSRIFDGMKHSGALAVSENRFLTSFEHYIPLPFIPNVKSSILYEVFRPSADRRIYRYQLLESNSLTQDDGFIWLEETTGTQGEKEVLFAQFDFFDASWGIAKALAPRKIWNDSVRGLDQSDIALQLKSENPDWPDEKVLEESKKVADEHDYEKEIKNRGPLQLEPSASAP